MRQINLDQIKALIEVINCGSFTAAAHTLNLTQPAVSLQVQELESRFQVSLVERAGRRIRPTPAGRELAQIGQRVLDEVDEAHRVMRRYADGFLGRVRLGMSMTTLIYLMPPVIRDIKTRAPLIELSIRTGVSEATLLGLKENTIDIGLCIGPIADTSLDVVKAGNDLLVAIFPAGTQSIPEIVTPEMIAEWPLVFGNAKSALRHLVEKWMSIAGAVPKPVMELDNVAAIMSVVAAGIGASIVPALALGKPGTEHEVIVRPLSPEVVRDMLMVQRKDKLDDPTIGLVREVLIRNIQSRSAA